MVMMADLPSRVFKTVYRNAVQNRLKDKRSKGSKGVSLANSLLYEQCENTPVGECIVIDPDPKCNTSRRIRKVTGMVFKQYNLQDSTVLMRER